MKNELVNDEVLAQQAPVRRTRWMVVDDDDGVRNFLACLLESQGFAEVARFRSGREALVEFQAMPGRYDFVITDFDMPGMNGVELCRAMRLISPHVKVALATGSGIATEANVGMMGFCGLLPKPFPAAEVWRLMRSVGVLPE